MKTGMLVANEAFSEKNILVLSVLALGSIFGGFVLHPFSMLVQDLHHPVNGIELSYLLDAVNAHHIPMTLLYAGFSVFAGYGIFILGAKFGAYENAVEAKDPLIPICSYCKKIRDDDGTSRGSGTWSEVEVYFSRKRGSKFTHGICPGCIDKFLVDLEGNPYGEL